MLKAASIEAVTPSIVVLAFLALSAAVISSTVLPLLLRVIQSPFVRLLPETILLTRESKVAAVETIFPLALYIPNTSPSNCPVVALGLLITPEGEVKVPSPLSMKPDAIKAVLAPLLIVAAFCAAICSSVSGAT